MKTHLKLFYIFFSKHVKYHTPVEILSRVQFCTIFVHLSTSQRVNKSCTKLEFFFFFFLMMLYSSFVTNTLKKFPRVGTVSHQRVQPTLTMARARSIASSMRWCCLEWDWGGDLVMNYDLAVGRENEESRLPKREKEKGKVDLQKKK